MKAVGEPNLRVRILSPTKTHYDGQAVSVSANNKVGRFDILAQHANFFSLLTEGEIVVDTGPGTPIHLPVSQGIVKVTNNTVTFFVDIEPSYVAERQAKPTESPS